LNPRFKDHKIQKQAKMLKKRQKTAKNGPKCSKNGKKRPYLRIFCQIFFFFERNHAEGLQWL